jgi:drug/metabolite transporter superfamily protein YnfA
VKHSFRLPSISNESISPHIDYIGVAEIVGGWMVWASIRGNSQGKKPWWFAILGSLLLVSYGFIPCLQPTDSFGRIYAIYGGYFILLSFLFGWILDGDKPDLGDLIGGSIAISGAFVIMLWPRAQS